MNIVKNSYHLNKGDPPGETRVESMGYSDNDLYKTLDAPTYTQADASRLTNVSRGRVRRWLKGYWYSYEITGGDETREVFQNAVVHRSGTKDTTYASFLDLIDLLFVKKFLDYGFSLQYLRKAFDEARKLLETSHFANNKFFTSGSNIYLQLPRNSENILALMSGGQWAIAPIIVKLSHKIDFHDVTGLATRWYPLGRDGLIVVDPQISFGRPTIMGRGIATNNIYDLYLGENERVDPVSKWLDVPRKEVQAAVDFEYSLFS